MSVTRLGVVDGIHLHHVVAKGRRHIAADAVADAAADGPAVGEEGGAA